MKADLVNYRQSPRKVRLMANLVRGQTVAEALLRLKFITKRASSPMAKLIQSAMANLGTAKRLAADQLIIKNITVDKGLVFKRFRAGARGQSSPVRKRTSRISVILEANPPKAKS